MIFQKLHNSTDFAHILPLDTFLWLPLTVIEFNCWFNNGSLPLYTFFKYLYKYITTQSLLFT